MGTKTSGDSLWDFISKGSTHFKIARLIIAIFGIILIIISITVCIKVLLFGGVDLIQFVEIISGALGGFITSIVAYYFTSKSSLQEGAKLLKKMDISVEKVFIEKMRHFKEETTLTLNDKISDALDILFCKKFDYIPVINNVKAKELRGIIRKHDFIEYFYQEVNRNNCKDQSMELLNPQKADELVKEYKSDKPSIKFIEYYDILNKNISDYIRMQQRSMEYQWISANSSLKDAIDKMAVINVNSLLVLSDFTSKRFMGLLTRGDILRYMKDTLDEIARSKRKPAVKRQ